MKNEKEIWLDSEEIKQLLEGGLYWKDIETKISLGDTEGFKRNLKKEDVSIDDIIWEPVVTNQPAVNSFRPERDHEVIEDSDQLRAILLGEEKQYPEKDEKASSPVEVIKDRQIDLKLFQEQEIASIPLAASQEESDQVFAEESEVMADEKDSFSDMNEWKVPSVEDKRHLDEDFYEELENERTPFGGLKLIALLVISAAVTFGFWNYFLSRY